MFFFKLLVKANKLIKKVITLGTWNFSFDILKIELLNLN